MCFSLFTRTSQIDNSFHDLYAVPVGLSKKDCEGPVILLQSGVL